MPSRAPRSFPPKGDPLRQPFYRWAVFIIAAVYPTYTYGDDPKKWVADETASKLLRESTDAHRKRCGRSSRRRREGRGFLAIASARSTSTSR
jgi:GST-like protein